MQLSSNSLLLWSVQVSVSTMPRGKDISSDLGEATAAGKRRFPVSAVKDHLLVMIVQAGVQFHSGVVFNFEVLSFGLLFFSYFFLLPNK